MVQWVLRRLLINVKSLIITVLFAFKKGFLHLLIPPEKFTLIKGEQMLTTYTFNTYTAQHTFCSICGIHSFYRPRSHPGLFDINLNCLDQVNLSDFKITSFDGQNWEKNVKKNAAIPF